MLRPEDYPKIGDQRLIARTQIEEAIRFLEAARKQQAEQDTALSRRDAGELDGNIAMLWKVVTFLKQ